jgi:hypothetical protein
MARAKLTLTVIRDQCLGHEIFRGSAPAGGLVDASWIDFHDPNENVEGYQREFDLDRSRLAASTQTNPICLGIRINHFGRNRSSPSATMKSWMRMPKTKKSTRSSILLTAPMIDSAP